MRVILGYLKEGCRAIAYFDTSIADDHTNDALRLTLFIGYILLLNTEVTANGLTGNINLNIVSFNPDKLTSIKSESDLFVAHTNCLINRSRGIVDSHSEIA